MDKESHPSFSYLAMDVYQKVGGFKTSSTDATDANRFITSIYQLSYMYVYKKKLNIYIYINIYTDKFVCAWVYVHLSVLFVNMYLYLFIWLFNLSCYSSIYSYTVYTGLLNNCMHVIFARVSKAKMDLGSSGDISLRLKKVSSCTFLDWDALLGQL